MLCKAAPTVTSVMFNSESSPSMSLLTTTFPLTDSFVIVETLLTSVKYAIYHAIGHCIRHSAGYCDATATSYLRNVTVGFVGGAIFTIPYLFLLVRNDSLTRRDSEVYIDHSHDWFRQLGAELFYSTIAGGVGAAVVGDVKVAEIFTGMLDGLCGPMTFYSLLYLVLKGALWAIAHW